MTVKIAKIRQHSRRWSDVWAILDAVVLRLFFELLLWMNLNKIINKEEKIYLKTQMFLYSNEIRMTIKIFLVDYFVYVHS